MERDSSAVECQTRNQVSPGSNPPLLLFWRLGIFVLSIDAPVDSAVLNEYLAIDSGENVSDLVVERNCCMARMLPGEAELVSEWTGLPGRAKSVQRFERSDGLDTALYKNYPFCVRELTARSQMSKTLWNYGSKYIYKKTQHICRFRTVSWRLQ